jgi:MYXO-CTERM domain-containing protein
VANSGLIGSFASQAALMLPFAVALELAHVQPATACSRVAPEVYEVDPSLRDSDKTAPPPFTDVVARVERRDNKRCSGGVCTESSCPREGTVELSFRAPEDDQAESNIGYRVVWLRGSVPDGARATLDRIWPLAPPSSPGEGTLSFSLGFAEVEHLDADIALVAVDLAGNESAASEPVPLKFSGCTIPLGGTECETGGCSISRVGTSGVSGVRHLLWVIAGLAGLLVRRRRWPGRCSRAPCGSAKLRG